MSSRPLSAIGASSLVAWSQKEMPKEVYRFIYTEEELRAIAEEEEYEEASKYDDDDIDYDEFDSYYDDED